jgi:hypothetical protein
MYDKILDNVTRCTIPVVKSRTSPVMNDVDINDLGES